MKKLKKSYVDFVIASIPVLYISLFVLYDATILNKVNSKKFLFLCFFGIAFSLFVVLLLPSKSKLLRVAIVKNVNLILAMVYVVIDPVILRFFKNLKIQMITPPKEIVVLLGIIVIIISISSLIKMFNFSFLEDDYLEQDQINDTKKQKLEQAKPTTNGATTENSYNPTERETHLQAIALLSLELANHKPVFITSTGKPKQSTIADILEREAKELFSNPKSQDTYRKRIAEALKKFPPQAD